MSELGRAFTKRRKSIHDGVRTEESSPASDDNMLWCCCNQDDPKDMQDPAGGITGMELP
jgi:hypothetical protein